MLHKLSSFEAEIVCCGQVRNAQWNGSTLEIHGLASFVEVAEVLGVLSGSGALSGWGKEELQNLGKAASERVKEKPVERRNAAPVPPPETEPARAVPTSNGHVLTPEQAEAAAVAHGYPPSKPKNGKTKAEKQPEPKPPQETEETSPAEEAAASDDFSAFTALNRLSDIVDEVRRRGPKTFTEVQAYIQRLRDAEVCPALDRVERQGDFDGRLRTCCASKQIEGAL